MKVKSLSHVQLSDPMDRSLPGSSVHGIFQARVLEWGASAFSDSIRQRSANFLSKGPNHKYLGLPGPQRVSASNTNGETR